MARFLLFAFLVGALCLEGYADGAGEEARSDLLPALIEPQGRRLQEEAVGGWQSPNPPSCVVDFADLLTSLIGATQGLIGSMIFCPAVFAEGVTYAEQQRICAIPILSFMTSAADAVADVEALAFDCFNQNQACGQAISSASGDLLDVGIAITTVIDICPFTIDELAFTCYAKIWSIVQLLVEAAKFIDVALATCPLTEGLSEPKPEGPAPTPTKVEEAPEPVKDTGADADAGDQRLFAATLSALGAYLPNFRNTDSGAERRLSDELLSPSVLEERLNGLKSTNSSTVLDMSAKKQFAGLLIEVEKHFRRALSSMPGAGPVESRNFKQSLKRIKALGKARDSLKPVQTVVV